MKLRALTLISALALTAIDGVLKYIAIKQPFVITEGCFDSIACFSLHQNYGIAFNLPVPMWLVLTISALIITIVTKLVFQFWKQKSHLCNPMILVLFGAIGNFADRTINGFTTDYLIFFNLSAINIADILIVSGVLLTMWYSFNTDMEKR